MLKTPPTSRMIGRTIVVNKFTDSHFGRGYRMNRTIGILSLLAVVSFAGACNHASAPMQTNANVNHNSNANSVPANVGVVTNNNGNENTSGVRPINSNANSNQSKNANGNANK